MSDTTEQTDLNVEIRYDDARARFLIWSNEHRMWWGPAERGYTGLIDEAGRYTLTHAMRICRQASVDGQLKLPVRSDITGRRIQVMPEQLVPAPELVLDAIETAIDKIATQEGSK